jgi:hypothetical protein
MIVYSKALGGLPLSLHLGRGSPLCRNLLLPIVSLVLTWALWTYTCKHVAAPVSAAEGEDGGEEADGSVETCSVKWFYHPFPVRFVPFSQPITFQAAHL